MQPAVSILTLGAVGDGLHDDTEALERAARYGGTVVFPAGVYLLRRQLEAGESLRWVGAGKGTVIRLLPADQTRPVQKHLDSGKVLRVFETRMLMMRGGTLLSIRHMTFDANKQAFADDLLHNGSSAYDHTVCIEVHDTARVLLEHTEITNALIEGVYLYRVADILIRKCSFHGNGFRQKDASGIQIDGCSGRTLVADSSFCENGFNGLLLNHVRGAAVQRVRCEKNGFDGVALWGGTCACILSDIFSRGNRSGINFRRNCAPRLDFARSDAPYCSRITVSGLTTEDNDFGIFWGCAEDVLIHEWHGSDRYNHDLIYRSAPRNITAAVYGAELSPKKGDICDESDGAERFAVEML